jgi:hypothetical protein
MTRSKALEAGQAALDLAPNELLPPDGARVRLVGRAVTLPVAEIRSRLHQQASLIFTVRLELRHLPVGESWDGDKRICEEVDLHPTDRFELVWLPPDAPPLEAWPRVSRFLENADLQEAPRDWRTR